MRAIAALSEQTTEPHYFKWESAFIAGSSAVENAEEPSEERPSD
jgi:hypothetical protein